MYFFCEYCFVDIADCSCYTLRNFAGGYYGSSKTRKYKRNHT